MLFGKRPFGEGKSQERVLSEGIILNATQVIQLNLFIDLAFTSLYILILCLLAKLRMLCLTSESVLCTDINISEFF